MVTTATSAARRPVARAARRLLFAASSETPRPRVAPVPFAEALERARARGVKLPDEFYALAAELRAGSFTITGLASTSQIQVVLDSLNANLAAGGSFRDWSKKVAAGEVPLALPKYRQELIFRQHARTAYMHGRLVRFAANVDTHPILRYTAVMDARTRPTHAHMNGYTAEFDAHVWLTWTPPVAPNCRCSLVAETREEAEAHGGVTKTEAPAPPDPDWVTPSPLVDRWAGVERTLEDKRKSLPAPLSAQLPADVPPALTLTDRISRGGDYARELHERAARLAEASRGAGDMYDYMPQAVHEMLGEGAGATLKNVTATRKAGRARIDAAARSLPRAWVEASDRAGTVHVRTIRGRAGHWHINRAGYYALSSGRLYRYGNYGHDGARWYDAGDSLIVCGSYDDAVHELTHRMQKLFPAIDDAFQEEHVARTAGEALAPLRTLAENSGYRGNEVARPDKYLDPYWGKEYHGTVDYQGRAGALEYMPMAIETLLGNRPGAAARLRWVVENDPDSLALALSALFDLTVFGGD